MDQMILKAAFDVEISSNLTDRAELLSNCGGAPLTPFSTITPGPVTFKKGNSSAKVLLNQSDASECIVNLIVVGAKTARIVRLRNRRRYHLQFNTVTRVMSFIAKPVTTVIISIRIGNRIVENVNGEPNVIHLSDNEVFISAPGAVALGIIRDQLLMKRGLQRKLLSIRPGKDIFADAFLEITPKTAMQFGLTAEKTLVSFDQINAVLRINPGK